ncbi:MAG: NosD domain-containing protein [Candidatus Woesearchaeota archaeon]
MNRHRSLNKLNFMWLCLIFTAIFTTAIFAAEYHCNDCASCNENISNAVIGDIIYLDNDIIDYSGSVCINLTGKTGVIFDCQGKIIDAVSGDDGIYGSNITNSTIKNCIINDFSTGIRLINTPSNNLIQNCMINSSGYIGIYLYGASNNWFINTTIKDSKYPGDVYGIYLESPDGNHFINITVVNNTGFDIFNSAWADSNCNNEFQNVNVTNGPFGYFNYSVSLADSTYGLIQLCNADNSNITNVTINGNYNNGLIIMRSSNVSVSNYTCIMCEDGVHVMHSGGNYSNLHIYNSSKGVYVGEGSPEKNIFSNITLMGNGYGISMYRGPQNNEFKNSIIAQSTIAGVYLQYYAIAVFNNTFYNNIFNNTVNVYSNNESNWNIWNTTLNCSAGPNIIGGKCIGGNYWATPSGIGFSENCTLSTDGICDSYYNITEGNIDWLPLTFNDYQTWLLNIHVNDSSGNGLDGVNITIKNQYNNIIFSQLTDSWGNKSLNITEFIANSSGTFSFIYNITFSKQGYVSRSFLENITNDRLFEVALQNQTGFLPNITKFSSNETTDLNFVADLTNVTNLTLSNDMIKIIFTVPVNVSGLDIDSNINFSDDIVSINTQSLSNLNVSASITIKNVSCPVNTIYYANIHTVNISQVFLNGTDCEAAGICSNIQCNGTTLSFDVNHFSSFAAGIYANLTIWDDTDNLTVYQEQPMSFFANYSNGTTPINGSGVYCEIRAGSIVDNMSFNSSSGYYEYTTVFQGFGNMSFNVTCNGSVMGYDVLSVSDIFTISHMQLTVCSSGCTFSKISEALSNISGTEKTIIINESGEYVATNTTSYYVNDTSASGVISIQANNVILDCNNSGIYGNLSGYAVYINGFDNVTIKNCIFQKFSRGILARFSENCSFINNTLRNNTYGIHLATENYNALLLNNTLYYNSYGIEFDSSNNSNVIRNNITGSIVDGIYFESSCGSNIIDTQVSSSGIADIYTNLDSNNTLLNVSYSTLKYISSSGWLSVKWYVDAYVNESLGNPVVNSSVVINSTFGNVFFGTTGIEGRITRQNLTSFMQNNATSIYYSNYTLVAYNGTHRTDISSFNLTTNLFIFLTFDTSAPQISSVTNSSITNQSAVITWITDDMSNSTVYYGTTTSLGSIVYNSTHTTTHSITLSLINNTLYYYNVSSCNQNGHCSVSSQYSFRTLNNTDTKAPTITSLQNTTITGTGAVISWTTDENANSTVKYGTASGSYTLFQKNESFSTSHIIILTNLSSETTYYYVVNSTDASGNSNQSVEYSFTTLDITPPAVISIANTTGENFAVITWGTNENSTSVVKYGTASSSYSITYSNSSLVTSHLVNLTGLSTGTYYYVVNSSDTSGNSNQSGEYTFTIVDLTSPSITINYPQNGTIVSDWANIILSVTTSEASTCIVTSYKLGLVLTTNSVTLVPGTGNLTHTRPFNSTGDSTGYDNYFALSCTDASSNSNSTTTYFKINDTTAPVITFHGPTPSDKGYANSSNVTINFSLSEPPAIGYPKLSIDGGTNITLTVSSGYYSYTKTDLGEGKHNITIYAVDSKGNNKTTQREFTVDSTAPSIKLKNPKNKATVLDCSDMLINVSVNEESTCEYAIYEDHKKDYDNCVDECQTDQDKCIDNADNIEEEKDCEDKYEECEANCDDKRYEKVDSGKLDELKGQNTCEDICDDEQNKCENNCDGKKDKCMDNANNNDEEDECDADYDDCIDNCGADYEECIDDCSSRERYYSTMLETCLADGYYLVRVACKDNAKNKDEYNFTFTMVDSTPPVVMAISPNNTTITERIIKVHVSTNEDSVCRLSKSNIAYNSMEYVMTGTGKEHSYILENLQNGIHTYYVLCNDTKGNVMTTPAVASFTAVGASDVSETAKTATTGIYLSALKKNVPKDFSVNEAGLDVTNIRITVDEEYSNAGFAIRKITDTSSVKKPDTGIAYQYFEITRDKVAADKLIKAEIKFRVAKSWSDTNRIDLNKVYLMRYTNTWEKQDTNFLSSDASYSYFEATSPGFSVFSIIGEQMPQAQITDNTTVPEVEKPSEIEGEKKLNLWLIIAVCVVVVGGGSAYYVYRSHRHPQQDSFAETQIHPTQNSAAAAEQPAAAVLDDVDKYILECSRQGFTAEQIRKGLISGGYEQSVVDKKIHDLLHYDPTEDHEVMEYVISSLKEGLSEKRIRKELLRVGHRDDEIDKIFAAIKAKEKQERKTNESDTLHDNKMPANRDATEKDELRDYIAQALQAGSKREDIENVLLEAGFMQKDIERKFIELDAASQSDENNLDKEVIEYIQLSAAKGIKKQDIRKGLENLGVSSEAIDDAFKRVGI